VTARYRISVDRQVCLGSGVCTGMAPKYFDVGEDARAWPVQEVVDADDLVLDAATCCPTEAITITDAETGEHLT